MLFLYIYLVIGLLLVRWWSGPHRAGRVEPVPLGWWLLAGLTWPVGLVIVMAMIIQTVVRR